MTTNRQIAVRDLKVGDIVTARLSDDGWVTFTTPLTVKAVGAFTKFTSGAFWTPASTTAMVEVA